MTLYAKPDLACKHQNKVSKSLQEKINELLTNNTSLKIAVGYVSDVGLDWLSHFGSSSSCLLIGLASEGLTSAQIRNIHKLEALGWKVRVSTIPNHSKLYLAPEQTWGSIGSSNLDSLVRHNKLELDIQVPISELPQVEALFDSWWERSMIFSEWIQSSFFKEIENSEFSLNNLSPEIPTVAVGLFEQTNTVFELDIKMENASNFNAFNAKPRAKIARSWYELEINVPTILNKLENFLPIGEEFTVITDDGYLFNCKRTGTDGKNLQSTPNLQILGKWLKGKLMKKGIIQYGELGTTAMLDAFGTKKLTIRKLKKDGYWLFCFGELI